MDRHGIGRLDRLDRKAGTVTTYRHDPADPASLSSDGVTAPHRPLLPWLDRLLRTSAAQVRWQDALSAIGLGAAMVIIQLLFSNDPGVVMR